MAWNEIKTAPIGPTIILKNEATGIVEPGYGEWVKGVGVPIFVTLNPTGVGRFKATHWQPMPEA